jgi:hypothetical protein
MDEISFVSKIISFSDRPVTIHSKHHKWNIKLFVFDESPPKWIVRQIFQNITETSCRIQGLP